MIEQGQVYSVEFQNFRRVHRNRANGELFAVEFEITEDEWHHLADFPQDAIGQLGLVWTERVGVVEKPKAKIKGSHGKFWQELHSFHNRPDVRHWLGVEVGYATEKAAIERLYEIFNVTSRTFISSDALRDWVSKMPDCDGALTVIENAKAKTQ